MKQLKYEQVGVAITCRGYDEYLRMFGLEESDLGAGPLLDIAAGGASFTAEACARGYDAHAVDPRYAGDVESWIAQSADEIEISTNKLIALQEAFDWSYYKDPALHRAGRERSLELFANHLRSEAGKDRYRFGQLPQLPFGQGTFSLVLCSHFLFLYAEQFDFNFHKQAVLEMMRLCKPGGQVRIYPLLSLSWNAYPHMDELLKAVAERGGQAEFMPANLPFIPGSDLFLKIRV
ncbi:Methyltransferase domain-containing protein [Paenibacillus algorifonticola]|uniref:Methyltransferase domain-containing protein n=1 Tax=Paenibacillus algorifonticola TaxID=684063 RepID=A0A1I2A011_9BACL|nr:class I SAM-dependent methyltransferase [Paenibacillus algorifonticola]SFE37292.1 Methyltransferase domain-containing protein [Paenibacillus algorifonticola]